MAQLLDHLGNPVNVSRLKERQAVASVAGVRPIMSSHPTSGLTPQRLAAILRSSEAGSPMSYLELAEDMEEKDLHYLGVLGTRRRAVTQLEITVEAASDDKADQRAADMVRTWIKRDELETELFDILDAVGKGFSRTEILWDLSSKEWTPVGLEWCDPRWFDFDPFDGKTTRLLTAGVPEPLAPFQWISHDHKAKSGLPIRGGLARPAAWAWLFKNYALKDWVSFAEIFGLPIRVGKYGAGETEENIRRLMQAVSDIGADAAAVIPMSMQMEFLEGKEKSGDVFERLCDYLDKQVSKGVLGQTATTDAAPGAGLSGSGSQHGDVREDIQRADAILLAATINRDLIAPYARLNIAGITQPPKIRIGRAEAWDPAVMMPAVQTFVGMGGRVGMSAIRDKLGLEDPAQDEELLVAPKAAAPAVETPGDKNAPPKPSGAPGSGKEAPEAANDRQAASLAFLGGIAAAMEGGRPGAAAPLDAADRLAEEIAGDWRPLVGPITDPLAALLESSGDLETFRDRLTEAMAADPEALAEALARSCFSARLAGLAGLQLSDPET